MIYFDNAATTSIDENVINEMIMLMREEYGNASSLYRIGRSARKIIDESRANIAHLLGAESDEIVFTSGGTESDNSIIYMAKELGVPEKSNIIVSCIEHHAILEPASRLSSLGFEVRTVEVDSSGMISIDDLLSKVDSNTVLVSIMYANNEIGTIQPIKQINELIKQKNSKVLFHSDAVQAVGHLPINLHEIGVDYISASAHKFNGPKGIGFLYVKSGAPAPKIILGGGQEKGLRSGTENVISIKGMSVALSNNINHAAENTRTINDIAKYILAGLTENGVHYKLNGSYHNRLPGNINIAINGIDGEGLLNVLDMRGIAISVGSACNSQKKTPSHVLRAIGVENEDIEASIRISVGKIIRLKKLKY